MLLARQPSLTASGPGRRVISGVPRSGKTAALLDAIRRAWDAGLDGNRVLLLTPDRRSARRLNAEVGAPPAHATGPVAAMSYHSFSQDIIRRWWPLVVERLGIRSATPEFLPFNLAQFACLKEYRAAPGNLQRLTIREQRLIVQVLSNMNLSAGNGLSIEDGWERVALGLGVPSSDPVIRDGLDLTLRFRRRCLDAGVLPVDLQVEAAGWLLEQQQVREDILTRYDLLALDDLDEFVPLMAERLTSLAGEIQHAIVTCGEDGGLRWLLGASVRRARALCDGLVANGAFQHQHLPESLSPSSVVRSGAAAWLAEAIVADQIPVPPDTSGLTLSEASRPDQMARQVVDVVSGLVDDGSKPEQIVLLTPYLDTLVASELRRGFTARGIHFEVEQRWQSLLDDRESRACLTALRCVNPGSGRKATAVEVADLLVTLTGENPIAVQPWVAWLYDSRKGTLREPQEFRDVPRDVRLLGRWAEIARNKGELYWQLEMLAAKVFAPHESEDRTRLVQACYGLAHEARRFLDIAPRFGIDGPGERAFFEYVDSNVVAADTGRDAEVAGVVLTTPYAFLISGRVAAQQCWLDVASPAWWEPPLLLLSNPHAMQAAAGSPAFTTADDDRVRGEVLGRIIRNLTARCDGSVYAFASFFGPDGAQLDGTLYETLLATQAVLA